MTRSMVILLMCVLGMVAVAECADAQQLRSLFVNSSTQNPFHYNMSITILPSHNQNADVMLLLHGYGSDNSIASILQSYGHLSNHLIAFNFPDFRIEDRGYNLSKSVYGSIDEILPVIYMLNKLVVEGKHDKVNLYGFSAGGGALINTLTILNTDQYDQPLLSIGVGEQQKKQILAAIQNGWILLDAPLKSMKRGRDPISKRYNKNRFNPIDNISRLTGLTLNIILYWEVPDEILSNRDDALYSERLMAANLHGRTVILEGNTGGHISYHAPLFQMYKQLNP